jgi:hypothetical protein
MNNFQITLMPETRHSERSEESKRIAEGGTRLTNSLGSFAALRMTRAGTNF